MFSKPKEIPEPPKIYLVMTEDGDIKGAFLDQASAEYAVGEANEGHAPFEPYFVNDIEIKASESHWRSHCRVGKAREKTEDDLK